MRKSDLEAQRERWRLAVAAVLAATRKDVDVTQRELGARVGWTRNMIAKMERGDGRHIELGDIVVIAQALNVKPELVIKRILMWNG